MIHRQFLSVVFILLFLQAVPGVALDPETALEKYIHHSWTTRDGLPQNIIRTITQDRKGFIWLGTDRGVVRFDGTQFKTYNKDNTDAISNNKITALLTGYDGRLWIGSYGGGLITYKDGQFQRPTTDRAAFLERLFVNRLVQDRDRRIWIGTTGSGLICLDQGKVNVFNRSNGLASDIVTALLADRRGNLRIGTPKGLHCLDKEVFTILTVAHGLANNHIDALWEDTRGFLWIGTREGIQRFRNQSGDWQNKLRDLVSYSMKNGLAGNFVRDIIQDRDGNTWAAENGGISRIGRKIESLAADARFSDNHLLCLYEDRDGNLWVGTMAGGLHVFRNSQFIFYTSNDGLSNNHITSIFQDRSGVIWIGTNGGGLNRRQKESFDVFTREDGLSSNYVTSICQDLEGTLWIGTANGLNKLNNNTFKLFTSADGLSSNSIKCLHPDKKGNLWIGTFGGGLNKYSHGRFEVFNTGSGLPDNVILSLTEDSYGNLWIGTNRGVASFDGQLMRRFPLKESVPRGMVLDIYPDAINNIWIATDNEGLIRYSGGMFQAYGQGWGFAGKPIYRILEDRLKNLWLSTDSGIYAVPKRRLLGGSPGKDWFLFQEDNGLKTAICSGGSQPAGWRTRDGKIWFPTLKGIAVMDPGQTIYRIKRSPVLAEMPEESLTGFSYVTVIHDQPVIIEEILVDGKTIARESLTEVSGNTKSIRFRFVALNYRTPGKTLFKYRLSDFDPRWQMSRENHAVYENLPAGDYEFKVYARNSDGNWSYEGDSYFFTVSTSFYQGFWFYLILTLLLAMVLMIVPRMLAKRSEPEPGPIIKYKTSSLTGQQSRHHLDKLLKVMVEEEPYLDPAMSLRKLSESLGITKEDLSQVINEQLGKNFKNFLNEYRIEAAKAKLLDPKENQYVLLKIAFDVGFNSKSVFNASFKKFTGVTPSQFKKQHQEQEHD
jgi:ligand-binding sensor domain-containing protein/AraC-like DNA-binding protein